MKRLANIKSTAVNGKVTITADIEEFRFEQPVQQVTVGYLNPANMSWPRHCQLSHEAFFVKAFGQGVGIMLDDLVAIASVVEPKTSFPPVVKDKLDDSLTVDIISELNPDLQWEVSDEIGEAQNWKKIEGATTSIFDKTKVKSGQFVRCMASSEAGYVTTNPVMVA